MSTSLGKVWLGPLSSGSSGITSPRAPQIAEADEATSIIKQRRGESVKERQKEETILRQGGERENEGGRKGTKQMELREGLQADEGQGRGSWLAEPHSSSGCREREGEEEKEKQQDRHPKCWEKAKKKNLKQITIDDRKQWTHCRDYNM